jgi:hypothetical protein
MLRDHDNFMPLYRILEEEFLVHSAPMQTNRILKMQTNRIKKAEVH